MSLLTGAVTWIFDLLLGPFAGHPAWGMVVVSVLTSVWALLIFKAVTPQQKLVTVRNKLLGHIYEMGMYQDHLGVLARIQRDLGKTNLRYLSLTLPALVALTIPMVLTLAQLDSRFAQRPLQAGETAVFSVKLDRDFPGRLGGIQLDVPTGIEIAAGPVRDTVTGAAGWRLLATEPGSHELVVRLDGKEAGKHRLMVGDGLPRMNRAVGAGWLATLWAPGADPLPGDRGLTEVKLELPDRHTRYLGLELNWLVAFMVFSLLGGLAIKDLLRVNF